MHIALRNAISAAFVLAALAPVAAIAQTVKIGYIDPLSGPFANVGEAGLKQFQFVVDDINARNLTGGQKLEIVPQALQRLIREFERSF